MQILLDIREQEPNLTHPTHVSICSVEVCKKLKKHKYQRRLYSRLEAFGVHTHTHTHTQRLFTSLLGEE